ncbi:ABC1 family-domain-containing protein [Haematococcus lacustris]
MLRALRGVAQKYATHLVPPQQSLCKVNAAQSYRHLNVASAVPAVSRSIVAGRYMLGASGLLLSAWIANSNDVRMLYLVPTRLARDVYTAASIVADYKLSLGRLEGEARAQALEDCHQRGAERLLQLCFANGGVYTKLGQHIGQLDHLLPEQYVVTMRNHLLDRCPVTPYSDVRRIIIQDLGTAPETLFRYFNPVPVASASLAQVHVAEDHQGRKLAVKVQHAGLLESSTADMATVEALVKAVRYIFPDFDYQWLVDEIKTYLPAELDFHHEVANANRCRALLNGPKSRLAGRVYIPQVFQDKCSTRVLTMEFVEGMAVSDPTALRRAGISPAALSRLIADTFNQMIFVHGDLHADPHVANMMVRKQDGRMQLILLDHGLYHRIDDAFRLRYAELWRSLVFADKEGIRRSSEAMGAGEMVPLFAGMLTQRPWDQLVENSNLDRLVVPSSAENRAMVQHYAQKYASEISHMLVRMPHELLLLLKTNDCLRSVDRVLGQPVNNFVVTARECTRALVAQRIRDAEARHAPAISLLFTRMRAKWDMVRIELQVSLLSAMMWLAQVRAMLSPGHWAKEQSRDPGFDPYLLPPIALPA